MLSLKYTLCPETEPGRRKTWKNLDCLIPHTLTANSGRLGSHWPWETPTKPSPCSTNHGSREKLNCHGWLSTPGLIPSANGLGWARLLRVSGQGSFLRRKSTTQAKLSP